MSKGFNENTRVQVPAILHLTRLGYTYIGKIHEENAGEQYDSETNILIDEFHNSFNRLNPGKEKEWQHVFSDIKQILYNDDLGRGFYKLLTSETAYKLVDFDNPKNNTYLVTGEFTCRNGDENFRPDITLFINGLPLVFIEVKKPNNHEGIVSEYKRIYEQRMPNKAFRRFFNITQLMIFSNNMNYDTLDGIVPVQGSFYCTGSRSKPFFNCFREENPAQLDIEPFIAAYPYKKLDEAVEHKVLSDFNCQVIFQTEEYKTNKNFDRPTNKILTSMCSPARLLYLLKYGILYLNSEKEVDGKIEIKDEKHIMRYQQFFASMAITAKFDKGVKSGIIWHTQGSGKTALAYYLNFILTDYFAKQNMVAKFYFIVDRLDLMEQATEEFENRGLKVTTAETREELMQQFKNSQSKESNTGEHEVVVVNIQKFAEDKSKVDLPAYSTNLQRIFIIDEAHRGYAPTGCFLSNLFDADKNAIKLALTGTPLLKSEKKSCAVFGDYIHTYYYDKSIADGYTVKLIREDIETSYKEKLTEVQERVRKTLSEERKNSLDKLVQQKEVTKADIVEHEVYVKELLRYIIKDFVRFRAIQGDPTLGAMIVAETGTQAKKISKYFDEVMAELKEKENMTTTLKHALILHDVGTKQERKQIVQKDYKKNMTVDVLVVFNMLLTGFDAPRLKKLYLGRALQDHNLLQAITRVNRPYKDMRYGYLVDFADIKANFNEINKQYLNELNKFNDPNEDGTTNTNTFTQILENPEQIIHDMKVIKQTLFNYDTENAENFSSQISEIEDKDKLLELKKALFAAKCMSNLVRTFGDEELKAAFEKVRLERVAEMLSEVQNHIDLINQKEAFIASEDTKLAINEAMLHIKFNFAKIGEEELKIISCGKELEEKRKRTLNEFENNFDPEDPEFITLRAAFLNRFKEHGFVPNSIAQFNEENKDLDEIISRLRNINKNNENLAKKYGGDAKFVRVHKRIREANQERQIKHEPYIISEFEEDIVQALLMVKTEIDQKVFDRNNILKKDDYFENTVYELVDGTLYKMQIESGMDDCDFIKNKVAKQYLNQYYNVYGV